MKCIALDIDGTLINSNHQISPCTLSLINDCLEKNFKIVLVTGRNYDLVTCLTEQYNLNLDVICNSGHEYVTAMDKTHSYISMNKDIVEKLLQVLLHYSYHISIFTNKGKYSFASPENYYSKHMLISEKKRGHSLKNYTHIPFFDKNVFLENYHQVSSIKEFLSLDLFTLKIDARNIDSKCTRSSWKHILQIDGITVDSSYEGFLECSDNTSNKSTMLKEYIKSHHIKECDTYVFGDSMNDIELFLNFDNSFAVANSHEEIKKHAKWIVADHNNDGVAEGLRIILKSVNSL